MMGFDLFQSTDCWSDRAVGKGEFPSAEDEWEG